jgi:hypothetical protein
MQEIRMECVRQAISLKLSGDTRPVIDIAEELYAFVAGALKIAA